MFQGGLHDETTFCFEDLLDVLVCDLDMLTLEVGDFLGKQASVVDGAWRHFICSKNTVGDGNTMIIFTKRWRLMNDTCSISVGDVGIDNNPECFVLVLSSNRFDEYEGCGKTCLTLPGP